MSGKLHATQDRVARETQCNTRQDNKYYTRNEQLIYACVDHAGISSLS